MKKFTIICTLAALFFGSDLQAQTTGQTAVGTAKAAESNDWQNWTFAATAIATAAGAIFVVSLHNGSAAH